MEDIRYAFRTLRRSPGFAAVAILTLAIGIGANTAIFSVVNAVLLRPLPYAQPDRLVRLWNVWEGSPRASISPAEALDYAEQLRAFERTGMYATGAVNLTGTDVPERVAGAFVSAGVLETLGVTAALGRVITAEEDAPNAAPVAVLGDGLWRRRFGADPRVIGRDILLNGHATTVIGVMPPGFRLPDAFAAGEDTDVMVPLGLDRATATNRGSHFLIGIGRLREGLDAGAARADMRSVAARFVTSYPDDYPTDMRFTADVIPLRDDITAPVRPALLILLGAVGLVLLVACANVANLLLSRAEGRRRELAVRAAMGAGRGRIARQLMTESIVLAVVGGIAGLTVAVWATSAFTALPDVPRIDTISIDGRVLAFALTASIVTGLLFGLAPMIQLFGGDLYAALRQGRGVSGGRTGERVRRTVIVAEIALALVLLAGAGLLARSFIALQSVDPGYRTDGVLTVRLSLPSTDYPQEAGRLDFFERLVGRVAALPGVREAGAVSNLPLATGLGDLNFRIEGRDVAPGDVSPRADWQVVTPGYLDAMGMRVLRGRGITTDDREDTPGVVVINEALARRYWPDSDPLGTRFRLGGGAGPGMVTIVGIVGDVRHASLDAPIDPQMYLAHRQFRFWNGGSVVSAMTVVAHADGDPAALSSGLRGAITAMDPQLPIGPMTTMEEVTDASVAQPRFLMSLLLIFAVAAMALAAVGVYGVMAYAVARRSHELSIRVALGARASAVAAMVVRQGLLLVGIGVAIGLAAALALTRLLGSLLYGVSATDPLTLAGVSVLLAAVALAACWIPARRATRADPMAALRAE